MKRRNVGAMMLMGLTAALAGAGAGAGGGGGALTGGYVGRRGRDRTGKLYPGFWKGDGVEPADSMGRRQQRSADDRAAARERNQAMHADRMRLFDMRRRLRNAERHLRWCRQGFGEPWRQFIERRERLQRTVMDLQEPVREAQQQLAELARADAEAAAHRRAAGQ